MLIAGNDDRFLSLGESEEVVVTRIGRAPGRRRRVGREPSAVPEKRDELDRVCRRYSLPQGRVGEGALELGQEVVGGDELEVPGEPAREDLRRRSGRGEQRSDENVGVESGPHSARPAASLVLSLDGKRRRFVFPQIALLPKALEDVEPELAPERLLDDLAVTPTGSSAADFHRSEDIRVDRERCSHLWHLRIIAS
jgi:hypothetical protein